MPFFSFRNVTRCKCTTFDRQEVAIKRSEVLMNNLEGAKHLFWQHLDYQVVSLPAAWSGDNNKWAMNSIRTKEHYLIIRPNCADCLNLFFIRTRQLNIVLIMGQIKYQSLFLAQKRARPSVVDSLQQLAAHDIGPPNHSSLHIVRTCSERIRITRRPPARRVCGVRSWRRAGRLNRIHAPLTRIPQKKILKILGEEEKSGCSEEMCLAKDLV